LRVFDEIALSPYTNFVDRMLEFLRNLEEQGTLTTAARADILCTILRRLGRHLTAFDLVKFHHRGANYPDLLLLDAVLKELLEMAERQPELVLPWEWDPVRDGRSIWQRMLGLQHGYFFRRRYEGHPIPDVPTSVGENMRVLPSPIPHVSEEAILDPACRTRLLFADDPIDDFKKPGPQRVVRLTFEYPLHRSDIQELGTALFLDRPLGIFKHPTEPDQTLLVSYVAFSRSVAERRFRDMHDLGMLSDDQFTKAKEKVAAIQVDGVPIPPRSIPPRPGVPSLEDALKVAPDFVLLRTTRRTVNDFMTQFDLEPVKRRFPIDFLTASNPLVIASGASPGSLVIHGPSIRLEFTFDPKAGYVVHRCHEYPAGGLRLVRAWYPDPKTGSMTEADLQEIEIRIGPRG
jgi:hypothetical protein